MGDLFSSVEQRRYIQAHRITELELANESEEQPATIKFEFS